MSECLYPCEACERHIKGSETACPFCSATLSEGFGVCAKTAASRAKGPLTRAAILFVGAATAAACSGAVEPEPGDDGGNVADASNEASKDAARDDGNPVAMYGPAPVDASPPTDSAADAADDADTGGPVALYGPVPVDSGTGGG
jgi:hypothetical protein